MAEISVFDELEELLEHLAEKLLALSLRPQPVRVALSGGSTPLALYTYILNSDFKDEIQWNHLHLWWGDERLVPASDSQSNYGEAYRTLFQHVPIPEHNLHPVQGEQSVEEELARLEAESQQQLDESDDRPSFDLIFLGVGEDGHTASLFPGSTDYSESKNWILAEHPETRQPRISLSAGAINNAKSVCFLVTGQGKAQVISEIFSGNESALAYPAANIFSEKGNTEWVLDKAAASLLT